MHCRFRDDKDLRAFDLVAPADNRIAFRFLAVCPIRRSWPSSDGFPRWVPWMREQARAKRAVSLRLGT